MAEAVTMADIVSAALCLMSIADKVGSSANLSLSLDGNDDRASQSESRQLDVGPSAPRAMPLVILPWAV